MQMPHKEVDTVQEYPSLREVRSAIPSACFERRLSRSLLSMSVSLFLTIGLGVLAALYLPLSWSWFPLWVLYALVCGTFATGVWVIAHECGHRSFCNGTRLQDFIGFVLHTSLLVPYFSWQRSHAVHHAKTNHLTEGETHVPKRHDRPSGQRALRLRKKLGECPYAFLILLARLLFGWPAYLLFGATGGTERGVTNHLWPYAPTSSDLFPRRLHRKVLLSAAGVVGVVGLLLWWSHSVQSFVPIIAVYVGPYLVSNAWLVTYTLLQHTDVDIPHHEDDEWSFVQGAFCSVDRPYLKVIDFLHHHIGSTHVAHHLDAKIPHYNAGEATKAIAAEYPDFYRYDATPVSRALWRVSKKCFAVAPAADGWKYTEDADL